MMDEIKKQILLSALSDTISKRDRANTKIEVALANGQNVDEIAGFFREAAICKMTIEDIQIYYAKNFKPIDNNIEKKDGENDNNS